MSFPPETLAWAEKMARRVRVVAAIREKRIDLETLIDPEKKSFVEAADDVLRKLDEFTAPTDLDKKAIARELYFGLQHGYGFLEAVLSDNWMPWPEDVKKVTCHSQAVATYVVAKELGLNPKITEYVGFCRVGSDFMTSHSQVTIDVSQSETWAIDQTWGMYGPITFRDGGFTVENLDYKPEAGQPFKKADALEHCEFVVEDVFSDDDVVRRMEHIRSLQGLLGVISSGQRLGFPEVNMWKSIKHLPAPWYVQYHPEPESDHELGRLRTLVHFERLLVKDRDLEYIIVIGNDGDVVREYINGYFSQGVGWAKALAPIQIVHFPAAAVHDLLDGIEKGYDSSVEGVESLADLHPDDHAKFENDVMNNMINPESTFSQIVAAARESYRIVHASKDGDILQKFLMVEALYQKAKEDRPYFFGEKATIREMEKMTDPPVKRILRNHRVGQGNRRAEQRRAARLQYTLPIMESSRLENPEIRRYLDLRTQNEKIDYMLEHQPPFMKDAIDRHLYFHRRIKVQLDRTGIGIEHYAREQLGTDYDNALMRAYGKFFAEFLGHAISSWPALSLEGIKNGILQKITDASL